MYVYKYVCVPARDRLFNQKYVIPQRLTAIQAGEARQILAG